MKGVRTAALSAALAATAACSQQPTVVSLHDLDRPTDMVFGCVGLFPQADGPAVATGLPMKDCPDSDDTSIHRRFGFIPNSARGELSVIQIVKTMGVETDRLVDLDLAIAGYNAAPLGELPEALAISSDGCRLVTANRGSCDLTVVDPGRLMASTIAAESQDAGVPEASGPSPTQTVVVRTGSGKPLAASPYEIQFLPQDVSTLDPTMMCLPAHPRLPPIGWKDDPAAGWKAVVTFPTCDLVAVVDLPSGMIVDSVKVKTDANGNHAAIEHLGAEPVCPIECGVGARPAPDAGMSEAAPPDGAGAPETTPDAGAEEAAEAGEDGAAEASEDLADGAPAGDDADAGDDGTAGADDGAAADGSGEGGASDVPAPPPVGPFLDTVSFRGVGPLALHPLEAKAYVGLTNAPQVVTLFIAQDTGALSAPDETDAGIFLPGANGVRRVRLSVDPFGDPQFPFVVSGAHQTRKYLYAIVNDGSIFNNGTIRVIDLSTLPLQECDTNIDLAALTPAERADVAGRDCVTVAEAQQKNWHNPLIIGPGIHLPSNPRDIAVTRVGLPDAANVGSALANQLLGVFAFVLMDNGAVSVVNIDPSTRSAAAAVNGTTGTIPEPLPLPNSLRNRNWVAYTTTLDTTQGPPRVDLPPTFLPYGPRLEHVIAFDTKDNGFAANGMTPLDTWVNFPNYFDKGARVSPQTWSVSWEGGLIGIRFTGLRQGPTLSMDTGTVTDSMLIDQGGAFCDSGVANGDIVTLYGCTDNSQCGAGQVCVRSSTAAQSATGLLINGLCLNPDSSIQDTQVKVTCRRLLESVRRYVIVATHPGALVLRPHIDEYVQVKGLPGNPFLCKAENEPCGPPDSPDTSYGSFKCKNLAAPGDPTDLHCVNPCAVESGASSDGGASTDGGADAGPTKTVEQGDVDCRAGRKCVDFGHRGGRLCADAPSEATEGEEGSGAHGCFPQLTAYSIQAGRGFLVQGNVTGIPVATVPVMKAPPGTPPDLQTSDAGFCPPPALSTSPLAYRISLDGPACDVTQFQVPLNTPEALLALNARDAIKDPMATNLPLALLKQPPTTNPNPCLVLVGLNDSDAPNIMVASGAADGGAGSSSDGGVFTARAPGQHIAALFRNPELQFLLTNIEQQGESNYQIQFDVHGGFVAQSIGIPADIEIGLPARLLTSPITSAYAGPTTADRGPSASYLFVVDERRPGRNRLSGGATRGQILRINLQRYNGSDTSSPLLLYDDISTSGGFFPIQ